MLLERSPFYIFLRKNLSDWASRSCYSPGRCSLYCLSVGFGWFNMVRPC